MKTFINVITGISMVTAITVFTAFTPANAADCAALQAEAQAIGEAAENINNGQTQDSICQRAKKVKSDIDKFMKANTAGLKECGASDADIKGMKNSLSNSDVAAVCGT